MYQRRRNNNLLEKLRDGQLEIGNESTERVNGKLVGKTFQPSVSLAFNFADIREQDHEIFSDFSKVEALKVKTYCIPDYKRKNKVKLEDKLYDIVKVDADNDRMYMFWYLERKDA